MQDDETAKNNGYAYGEKINNYTMGEYAQEKIDELYQSPDCVFTRIPSRVVDGCGNNVAGRTRWAVTIIATLPGDFDELIADWRASGLDIRDLE